jgi:acid phosphatase family membrane protein YuiD
MLLGLIERVEMGKKKKKPRKGWLNRIKKVVIQQRSEIVVGLITGIVTNFLTDAVEDYLQRRKNKTTL